MSAVASGLSVMAKRETDAENGWQTPRFLVERVRAVLGDIYLDPCTTKANPCDAARFYTPADDGILMPWEGRVYCNPPYGRTIAHWVDKAIGHAHGGGQVVMLVPARCDSRWFHRLSRVATGLLLFSGRLSFESDVKREGKGSNAPFPCALFGLNVDLSPMRDLGIVYKSPLPLPAREDYP